MDDRVRFSGRFYLAVDRVLIRYSAVVFWYAEKGVGGQNWTYFEALYFTYTAQLTIGIFMIVETDVERASSPCQASRTRWKLPASTTG